MPEFLLSPTIQKAIFSLLTILAAFILTRVITRIINRQIKDLKRRHAARKTIVYIFSFLAILIVIVIWARGGGSIATHFDNNHSYFTLERVIRGTSSGDVSVGTNIYFS